MAKDFTNAHAFQTLYTVLHPKICPFVKSTIDRHPGSLGALTYRLGSTQKPALATRAGSPSIAGTLMYLPV